VEVSLRAESEQDNDTRRKTNVWNILQRSEELKMRDKHEEAEMMDNPVMIKNMGKEEAR